MVGQGGLRWVCGVGRGGSGGFLVNSGGVGVWVLFLFLFLHYSKHCKIFAGTFSKMQPNSEKKRRKKFHEIIYI